MKKLITGASIILMLCFALILTAATQQGKEKKQQGNSHQENKGKANKNQGKNENNKMDPGNNQHRENNKGNEAQEKDHKQDRGNDKVKSNQGNNENNNAGRSNDHKNKDQNYYNGIYGYNWNNDNFPDRKKYRKQEKVTICHKISGGKDGVNINVSENAVKAHLNHGDVIGNCPTIKDRRYSDIFYNDTYLAKSYSPATSQFYNGAPITFGSKPVIDAWLKVGLKRANLFVKYEYANQRLFSNGYYTVNRYPMPDRLLHFGVTWNFYD